MYYDNDWSLFQLYLTVSLIVLKKASEQHVNEVSRRCKQQETENRRYLEIRKILRDEQEDLSMYHIQTEKKEKLMHLG